MSSLCKFVLNFLKKEDGPTAVEYAVLLGLIITVCVTAIATIGQKTEANFNAIPLGNALASS